MNMNPLPKENQIYSLAKATSFPASKEELELNARRMGFIELAANFLKVFPYGQIFNTRSDFIDRCEEMEIFTDIDEHKFSDSIS